MNGRNFDWEPAIKLWVMVSGVTAVCWLVALASLRYGFWVAAVFVVFLLLVASIVVGRGVT